MCIDQVLMPYWESLTLLLKCHYVKITVAVEVLLKASCGLQYIRLTLTAMSLSSFPGASLSQTCMWRSTAVWEWLLRNSREPPAPLLSPFISSSHLLPWAKTKDCIWGRSFPHNPEHKIHLENPYLVPQPSKRHHHWSPMLFNPSEHCANLNFSLFSDKQWGVSPNFSCFNVRVILALILFYGL